MAIGTFATVINCIDGRAKRPVANWMLLNLHPNYVDQITEPGPDKVLTQGNPEQIAEIRRKVQVSITVHHSQIVALAAHADCAGNPISATEHRLMVRQAAEIVAGWGWGVRVLGLWVNEQWQVEVVCDTGSQGYVADTFAVAITCIDGRAKRPVADWMKQNFLVNYVDLITVPEPDTALLAGPPAMIEIVRQHLDYAVSKHHPQILAVVAHYDCAGNTISAADHRARIRRCVEVVKGWEFPLRILGLWVNEQWQVEVVYDSAAMTPTVKLPSSPHP